MQDLLVRLDPWVRKVGFYTAYTLSEDEYVGAVDNDNIIAKLKGYGYEELRLLEAAKKHPSTGEVHHDSLRKVDPEDERRQYHVHFWGSEQAYAVVFSHYELRPDFTLIADESVSDAIERLREHYRPSRGETYLEGVACDALQSLVE